MTARPEQKPVAADTVQGERWKTLLLSVCVWLALLALLALAEWAVRVLRPQIIFSKLLNRIGNYYAVSPQNTFELRPNFRGTEPSMEFPGQQVNIRVNALCALFSDKLRR